MTQKISYPRANKFVQTAWIVRDLHSTISHWVETVGVGPFVVFDSPHFDELTYRGHPATIQMRGAIAQAGDMQIELIEQKCKNSSAYRDTVPEGRDGFHHMAVFAHDFDQEIRQYEAAGIAVAAQGRFGALRFAYIDTSKELGFMIELLDADAATRDVYAKVARLAQDWDGSDPMRSAHDL